MFQFFKKKKPEKPPLKFMDLNESNGKLFNDMGLDSLRYGNSEKAIFYFSKAIELQPEIQDYTVNRAEVYWNYQKPNLALIDLETAISLGSAKALRLKKEYEQEIDIQSKSRKHFSKLLDEVGVDYLYHMTHIDNLKSILQFGILSHNRAHKKGLLAKDISDRTVNSRRIKIHNYVPLYFNPKNPMLYRRKNIQDELVILCVNRELLFSDKVVITDGNAASTSTNFYKSISDLRKIDWNIIRSEYWSDFVDGKRIRCAETLIPENISPANIEQIVCISNNTRLLVSNLLDTYDIPISVNSKLFFS